MIIRNGPGRPGTDFCYPASRMSQDHDPTVPEGTRQGRKRWEKASREASAGRKAWKADFTTVSGAPVDPLAGPDSIAGLDPERDLSWPGE